MTCEIIPLTRLPRGIPDTYTYAIPKDLTEILSPGQAVSINFRNKDISGIVKSIRSANAGSTIKPIENIQFPAPLVTPIQLKLARWISRTQFTSLSTALKSIVLDVPKRAKNTETPNTTLPAQPKKRVEPSIQLFHPSTDANKVAKAVQHIHSENQQILWLVPERENIAPTIDHIQSFSDTACIQWDTQAGTQQRLADWLSVISGETNIVVGTRSALFAPFSSLGLIIMENEHDDSYKSEQTPRYHARDAAFELASLHNASLVHVTASPSLELYTTTESKSVSTIESALTIIDLKDVRQGGNFTSISDPLHEAIEHSLAAKQAVFLYHNRRGHSTSAVCEDCGHIINCPECDLPLVFHNNNQLVCHHCRYRTELPPLCPSCNNPDVKLTGKGVQKIEQEVQKLFKDAGVVRIDSDTKATNPTTLTRSAQIIIGTEYALTRINWKQIGTIGVINADQALYRADFRASERTYQFLSNLEAVAVKNNITSVIVQTYNPENAIYQSLLSGDQTVFYNHELALRKALTYPPYATLVKLIWRHANEKTAVGEAMHIYNRLRKHLLKEETFNVTILKPFPASVRKSGGKFQFHLVLKISNDEKDTVLERLYELVPLGWVFDIDPETLL